MVRLFSKSFTRDWNQVRDEIHIWYGAHMPLMIFDMDPKVACRLKINSHFHHIPAVIQILTVVNHQPILWSPALIFRNVQNYELKSSHAFWQSTGIILRDC